MKHGSGCLVCGNDLAYRTEAAAMSCVVCGEESLSAAACTRGHFVCDACHGLDALDWIEARCNASTGTDPIRLANELMEHPAVKMHGPEHHFLFPAVMASAYANAAGQSGQKPAWLTAIRQRSALVPGGFCGFQGACGAGIGMGIFLSVVTGATPVSKGEWGRANALTGRSLVSIAALGGPRCCKRDGWLAMTEAVATVGRELGVSLESPGSIACSHAGRNKECLGGECPFFAG